MPNFSLPLSPTTITQVNSENSGVLRYATNVSGTLGAAALAIDPAFVVANTASANTVVIQAVNVAQNNTIIAVNQYAQQVHNFANGLSGGTATDGVARLSITQVNGYAQSGYATANSAQANTIVIQAVNVTQNNTITAVNGFASGAFTTANGANGLASGAFNAANGANGLAGGAFTKANTAASDISVIAGINATQNSSITTITNNISVIQGVNTTQNNNITYVNQFVQAAYNQANSAVSAAGAITTVSGNAGTVTNGVYTTGSYSNPSWITSLAGSKISGDISGNAGTVTNGVYTSGNQTIGGTKTFSSVISGSIYFNYSPDGDRNASTKLPTTSGNRVRYDFSSASTAGMPGGNYAGVMTYAPWDGTTASTGDASYQLAFGSTATNGSGLPHLNIRKGIDSTWNSWYTIPHSGNYATYITQLNSLGVGTAASGTTGEIRATSEVTAYYSSDETLKENITTIDNALGKLKQVRGVMYDWKDSVIQSRGGLDDYFVRKHDTGVIAQDVEKVLPEVVAERPDGTKAVRYEKLAGIIIQAINELAEQVEEIKKRLD